MCVYVFSWPVVASSLDSPRRAANTRLHHHHLDRALTRPKYPLHEPSLDQLALKPSAAPHSDPTLVCTHFSTVAVFASLSVRAACTRKSRANGAESVCDCMCRWRGSARALSATALDIIWPILYICEQHSPVARSPLLANRVALVVDGGAN